MKEYNIADDGLHTLRRVQTPQGTRYQIASLDFTLADALRYWAPKPGTRNGLFYAALIREQASERDPGARIGGKK